MSSVAPWGIVKSHHHLATLELDRWEAVQQAFPAAVTALSYDSKWILYLKTSPFTIEKGLYIFSSDLGFELLAAGTFGCGEKKVSL